MPIYEYRCSQCHRKVSVLIRGSSAEPACPACGSSDLVRLFSTFAVKRPPNAVYDDILSDKYLMDGLMANDPRALAKWSRKMSESIGEDKNPMSEDWLDRMEHGYMPTQSDITKAQEDFFSQEPD